MKYAYIPDYIISYNKLNATARLLMGVIYSLSMKTGECFASNEYLSNKLGFTKRTIFTAISSLKKEDLIKVKNVNDNRRILITDKLKNNIEE